TVVPGVTSPLAGPAAAGIPATHRGVSQEGHAVSAHVAPSDDRSTVDWAALARSRATNVVLMGVERAGAVADAPSAGRRPADTPERALPEAEVRPPAVLIVGEVVDVARERDILHKGPGGSAERPGAGSAGSGGGRGH